MKFVIQIADELIMIVLFTFKRVVEFHFAFFTVTDASVGRITVILVNGAMRSAHLSLRLSSD